MPRYNDQLDDPHAVEAAYDRLATVYRETETDLEGMDELLGRLDDLVRDDPDLGTSTTLQHARTRTERYLDRLPDGDDDVAGLKTALDRVNAETMRELDRYPAVGTDRHYSLDARRTNL